MNKMVVLVFDTEERAFEGLSALKELHLSGEISLFATSVVAKTGERKVSVRKISNQASTGTSVGILTGTLVGILGGPDGIAVRSAGGSLGGLIYDIGQVGFDGDFIDEVSIELSKGKVSVIAEMVEEWTEPLNNRVDNLNGVVFRQNKSEVIDDQLKREAEEIITELLELEEHLKEANADVKKSIQKQIDKLKERRYLMKILIDNKINEICKESNAKYYELKEQLKIVGNQKKSRLVKRIDKLKIGLEKRKKKFSEAANKVSEFIA